MRARRVSHLATVYSAISFDTMIDWSKEQITPPPYLRDQCDEEIREYERVPLQLNISSNTQPIERLVQLNAQVGKKAGSSILRDGIVKATIESRQECPKLENKSNFHK